MATAVRSGTGRARWRLLLLPLVVLAGLAAWYHRPIMGQARTAAAFGAHITCSCRYIEGRSAADCRKDFEKGMGAVMISDDVAKRSVTARIPLLSSQTATYREGEGCVPEPWST